MLKILLLLGFWLFLGLSGLSFAGALHGAADSLAVFRHWWAAALALFSVALYFAGRPRIAILGLIGAGLAIGSVAMSYRNGGGVSGPYSLYQKNLLFHANSINRVIKDIRAQSPDFITLQEIAGENRALYWILAGENAAAQICEFSTVGDVAVLSRWPMVAGSGHCLGNQGAAAMKVTTPAGPVWLVSVHLHWPFPHGQAEQVSHLIASMDFLDAPVILAGDFNMVPWSHTVAALENVTGSKRAGPAIGTYELFGPNVILPIDHVLVPSGRGALETRPLLGSDHLGLLLRFDL